MSRRVDTSVEFMVLKHLKKGRHERNTAPEFLLEPRGANNAAPGKPVQLSTSLTAIRGVLQK
jgi:hypothetical protein